MVAAKAYADAITIESDANTLGAATFSTDAAFYNSALYTVGLTFTPVINNALGSFTSPPTGAPSTTTVVNIPGRSYYDGMNGFFKVTFTLPSAFSNAGISGAANVDDGGVVFLNGNALTPLFGEPGAVSEYGNVTFSTTSYLQPGLNTFLVSDDNYGGGPRAGAFYATITYNTSAIPEPSATIALAGLSVIGLIGYGWRRRVAKA